MELVGGSGVAEVCARTEVGMALVAAGEFEIEEHEAARIPATKPVEEHLCSNSQPTQAEASANNDSMPFAMAVTTATASVTIYSGSLTKLETISTTSSAPLTMSLKSCSTS